MKKVFLICALLVTMVATAFAQKVDYSQYNVIVQKGNITVLEKDGTDYRMIVGSLKISKKWYMLGHNKELAAYRFDKLLAIMENEKLPKEGRIDMFCGSQLRTFAKGEGEQRQFTFMDEDSKAKFSLTKQDCLELKDIVGQH